MTAPMVPAAAVAELLSVVRDALRGVYLGGDAAIERWATVDTYMGSLVRVFEVNARHPEIRDRMNLRDIEHATAAIREVLAQQVGQPQSGAQ